MTFVAVLGSRLACLTKTHNSFTYQTLHQFVAFAQHFVTIAAGGGTVKQLEFAVFDQ
jgi:hypothetical protein